MMAFLIGQIREQKLLDVDVDMNKFIKENDISEKAVIFSLTFDKKVYKEEKEVREYLQDKYYFEPKITDLGESFNVEVVDASQIDPTSAVELQLRRGIVVQAGDLVPFIVEFSEKTKNNLGMYTDLSTIKLSEGLPHIIQIAKVASGYHPQYGEIEITQEHLESMVMNFHSNITGVDLAVNEDHKKNEAFGWFKDVFLSFDKQTAFAQIQWNTKGNRALSEKDYRYFSPEFRFNYVHPLAGTSHGATLMGGALTNYPFLKMEAITALNNKNETSTKEKKMETIDLKIHQEKVVELSAKNTEIQAKLDAVSAREILLSEKVAALEAEKTKIVKEAAHKKLFDEQVINAAQLVALNEGKDMLEVLALSKVVNTQAKGGAGSTSNVIELSAKEKAVAESLGLSAEEYRTFGV